MNQTERDEIHAMNRIREILQMQDAEPDQVVKAVELLDSYADMETRGRYGS